MPTPEQDRDLRQCLNDEAAARSRRRRSEFLYDPASGAVYWFPKSQRPRGVILYVAVPGGVMRCGLGGEHGIPSPRGYDQVAKLPGIVRAGDPAPTVVPPPPPKPKAAKPQPPPPAPAADTDPFGLDDPAGLDDPFGLD